MTIVLIVHRHPSRSSPVLRGHGRSAGQSQNRCPRLRRVHCRRSLLSLAVGCRRPTVSSWSIAVVRHRCRSWSWSWLRSCSPSSSVVVVIIKVLVFILVLVFVEVVAVRRRSLSCTTSLAVLVVFTHRRKSSWWWLWSPSLDHSTSSSHDHAAASTIFTLTCSDDDHQVLLNRRQCRTSTLPLRHNIPSRHHVVIIISNINTNTGGKPSKVAQRCVLEFCAEHDNALI